jgi:hypothetical protein
VKDAFGVERVSKASGPPVPEGPVKYSTYNKAEADEWAKTAGVQSRNTARGVEYMRPAWTSTTYKRSGLKAKILGRGKPTRTSTFEEPTGGIKTSKYDSPAYLRAQRKAAKGVSKAFTIGDDKRVRQAKLKERTSGMNTDLAAGATAAGASHAAIGSYNRWAEKYPNLKQLHAPGAGALTNTRVLKPVQLAQTAGGSLPGKAGRIISHPALLGGTPLTVANYRQHQKDESRVHRLEVRYPKRKKEKS